MHYGECESIGHCIYEYFVCLPLFSTYSMVLCGYEKWTLSYYNASLYHCVIVLFSNTVCIFCSRHDAIVLVIGVVYCIVCECTYHSKCMYLKFQLLVKRINIPFGLYSPPPNVIYVWYQSIVWRLSQYSEITITNFWNRIIIQKT